MATGTVLPPPPPAGSPAKKRAAQAESLIDDRIQRTRRQVRGVEIVSGMLALAVGTLAYLLAASLVDHWLVTGGLGFWGRLLLMAGLVLAAGWYFCVRVLPLVVRRINPLFAAQTIEASQPTLKNSVINFLMLRRQPKGVPELVYRAVEERAADDLSHVQVELAVDRRPAIRLGYVLAAVLAVACLYLVLSPKNPLVSFGRVMWPWADLPAPTRVSIDRVEPGDASFSRGDVVPVAADVRGLAGGEEVSFYYTTADGQIVNQAIPMKPVREGDTRYVVPTDSFVARQNTEYYLAAGDCTTRRFKIEVQVAPAIVVDRLIYDYPAYTGLPRAVVEGQGDVRANEGTRVTVEATANLEIGKAQIDLGCDGRRGVAMKTQGQSASGQFTLRMDRDDPSQPEYRNYQLRFADVDGRENRRPTRYEIQVIADRPPRVALALEGHDEVPEEIQVPANGAVEFKVSAEDPDFGLRRVALEAVKEGKSLPVAPLLDPARLDRGESHRGPFAASSRFEPAKLGLKPGDVVFYSAVAEDNKEPLPHNRAQTDQRRMVIVDPQRQPPAEGKPGEGQGQGQGEPKPGQEGGAKPKPDQPQQPKPEEKPDQGPNAKPQPGEKEKPQAGDSAEPKQKTEQGQGDQKPEPGQAGQNAEQSPGEGQAKPQAGDQGQGKQPEEPRQPVNPDTNPTKAFNEILQDKKEQEEQQGNEPKPGEKPEQKPEQGPNAKPDAGDNSKQQPSAKPETGEGAQPKPGESPTAKPQTGEGASQKPEQGASAKPDAGQGTGENPQPKPGDPMQGPQQPNDGQKPTDSSGHGSEPGEKPLQKIPDNEKSGAPASKPEEKPASGQGAQSQGQGTEEKPKPAGPSESQGNPKDKGGDPEDAQGSAGAGKPSESPQGSPSPQGDNQHHNKKPGETKPEEPSKPEAESPGIADRQSDSSGDTAGDRQGGGEKGGGQRANQKGAGAAGTQSAADEGGSAAEEKGEGEIGTKPGEQVESPSKTGNTAKKKGGPGTEPREKPGSGQGETPHVQQQPGEKGGKRAEGQHEGGPPEGESPEKPNARGPGASRTGGEPGQPPPSQQRPQAAPDGSDPNLQYARKATDMALEHLRDQLKDGDSRLLEKLGWTRDDAEAFLKRWEQLKRQAADEGPGGEARKELDEALKNLGLRPRGTARAGGGAKADNLDKMREGGRIPPPPQWADQFRAFKMGVRGENEK